MRLRKMSDIAEMRDRNARVRTMIGLRRVGAPDSVLRDLEAIESRHPRGLRNDTVQGLTDIFGWLSARARILLDAGVAKPEDFSDVVGGGGL